MAGIDTIASLEVQLALAKDEAAAARKEAAEAKDEAAKEYALRVGYSAAISDMQEEATRQQNLVTGYRKDYEDNKERLGTKSVGYDHQRAQLGHGVGGGVARDVSRHPAWRGLGAGGVAVRDALAVVPSLSFSLDKASFEAPPHFKIRLRTPPRSLLCKFP